MSTSAKVGHTLAKVLRIKLQNNPSLPEDPDRPGQSLYSVDTRDSFEEDIPTTTEWIHDTIPTRDEFLHYCRSLFPFTQWIGHYNLQWLFGDLVAGITIGAVVVPQGMAYATLANLEPQFGLYSSFMGVLIYWFFATSKDITIGPVAVMSTIVGNIVTAAQKTDPSIPGHVIASALAVIAGAIICFLGLARLGWFVELIPLVSICAFMTGSAINIAAGQVPTLMGISSKLNTRASTYLVIINTLKNLKYTTLDAAMGLTALFTLYFIRSACSILAKKFPSRQKLFFFLSTLRAVFVILLYTMVSWLANRDYPKHKSGKFKILGTVPRGFQNAAVPTIDSHIIKLFADELPASIIVLLIEHIAISKSFGRVNNYIINPSQELVAIGVTNLLGPFLGAYPATGSFSRTAIKSKAGVRTPFAGVITAVVVLLAIYALPAVFFYIPSASLSAVIIHAVGDLITPPNTLYQFWRVNPLEVLIFFVGVFVTIFSTIENGIYSTICISAFVLLFRIVKADGRFLGKVKIHSVLGDHVLGDDSHLEPLGEYGTFDHTTGTVSARNIFLPIDHKDGSNPDIEVTNPYPGIFIYRFSEGFNYPNANHYLDQLTNYIFATTRRTNPNSWARPGDRPWNDPGPRRGKTADDESHKPVLKAIILDFSSINNIDATSIQQLIDVRNQLARYAAPEPVDWHFANINNRWTKRALVSAGFGYPTLDGESALHRWKGVFSIAEIGGSQSAASDAERKLVVEKEQQEKAARSTHDDDAIHDVPSGSSSNEDPAKNYPPRPNSRLAVVHGMNRPLFHIDLTSALQSAITNVEARDSFHDKGGPGIGVEP